MFHYLTNIEFNLLKNGLEAVPLSMVHRQEILNFEPVGILSTHLLKPPVMAEAISKPGRPPVEWSTD